MKRSVVFAGAFLASMGAAHAGCGVYYSGCGAGAYGVASPAMYGGPALPHYGRSTPSEGVFGYPRRRTVSVFRARRVTVIRSSRAPFGNAGPRIVSTHIRVQSLTVVRSSRAPMPQSVAWRPERTVWVR